jgi:hypothetical protein
VPALSTRTPDRRNRLTLPPRQFAKSGRLSKKLVNDRTGCHKPASAGIITTRHARRKNTMKMQRRKILQASEVSRPAFASIFYTKTRDKGPVTIKSLRIS